MVGQILTHYFTRGQTPPAPTVEAAVPPPPAPTPAADRG
jgi:hypothetical protein